MQLGTLDWAFIASYFVFILLVGLAFRSRAGQSITEYFISGQAAPWWLAGTSMVATTFAADTPLAVTGMVVNHGIAGNWLWWNFLFGGMLTVFFYARLWRRAGVMTDVEFAELRYSGRPAAILRGFRAIYLALPINCIIIGWVNLAMVKILMLSLGVTRTEAVLIILAVIAFTSLISTLAGLWGVLVTDLVQFVIMIGMAIFLAVQAVSAAGGLTDLKAKILEVRGAEGASLFNFIPPVDSPWMPFIAFCVYLSLNWWASWYPGAEPGGGGYIAQRMFSARDERHSLLATLWFNIAHYALRPWPWILVGLAVIVLYPGIEDPESGYVRIVVDYLPSGWRGLMLAGFLAAYVSTVSTMLNWGASYLVNDFYKRFLVKGQTEKHYVRVAQLATVLLTVISAIVSFYLETIAGAWRFLIALGAGTGGVLLLRWYWWRINAWSEISAMIAAFVVSMVAQYGFGWRTEDPREFAYVMIFTVSLTTLAWLVVTFLTPAEPQDKLIEFYRRTYPSKAGWRPIAELVPEVQPTSDLTRDFFDWVAGCVLVFCALFATGKFLLGDWLEGLLLALAACASAYFLYRDLSQRGWQVVRE